MSQIFKNAFGLALIALTAACSSSPDERSPASTNRAGRPYTAPKVMNRTKLDTNSLYNACIREREASYCNNRLGR